MVTPWRNGAGYSYQIGEMHEDLDLVDCCTKNNTTTPSIGAGFVEGGHAAQWPPHLAYMVEADEREWRLDINVTTRAAGVDAAAAAVAVLNMEGEGIFV
jgi:hypothetical protein